MDSQLENLQARVECCHRRHVAGRYELESAGEVVCRRGAGALVSDLYRYGEGLGAGGCSREPVISRPTLGQRWRSVLVLGFGYLPDSRKAPPFTQPQGIPQERILAEIAASIAA